MSQEKIDLALRAANPIAPRNLAALDLAAGEAELGRALIAEPGPDGEPEVTRSRPDGQSRRPRSALLVLTGATVLAAAAAVFLLVGGTSETPAPAYGAELVRFAESTPLLLLEGPGWRVENVNELNSGEGTMKFVRGKPGAPSARQRWVDLDWNNATLSEALRFFYGPVDRVPGRKFTTTIPTLGTKVYIDTRAESSHRYGGPGDHEMLAVWAEDGHVLELSTRVPDLATFRERLGWLHRVDAQTWLDAMPAKVIKAADRGAAVREMLRGIPLPPGFDPAKISNQKLTTSRYEVGVAVGGGVACEWFSRWGKARADHDAAAAQEAERVLQGAGRWPIFREMSKEGAYPAVVVEYAEAMPSGRWYGRPLLPDVNQGLGCAEIGFPLR
jgi:hypothetical protein